MRPAGFDVGEETAAGGEFAADEAGDRFRGGDDIAQHAIDGILVKNSKIAIGEKVHFQSFEFEAKLARLVLNDDRPVIWQARLRAHGSIFREADGDFIAGKVIRPSVEMRELGVDSGARVCGSVIGHGSSSGHSTRKDDYFTARCFVRVCVESAKAAAPGLMCAPQLICLVLYVEIIN